MSGHCMKQVEETGLNNIASKQRDRKMITEYKPGLHSVTDEP